ncbi:MAG TPA: signal peptidase I [Clostridium sp.]|nr:signal peptidase I [Clostridium sp.]
MKKDYKDYLKIFLVLVLVIMIRVFVIDIITVEGISMYPTLNEYHDKVILEKYKQFTDDYDRGDIVVVKLENRNIIKRVIGLPNESIEIKNSDVYINGELFEEPYLDDSVKTYPDMTIKIPSDSIFVMGDNREYSLDSRSIGAIKIDDIMGKSVYRFNLKKRLFNDLN